MRERQTVPKTPKNYVVKAKVSREQYELFQNNKSLRGYSENTDFILNATIGGGFWIEEKLREVIAQNNRIINAIERMEAKENEKELY